MRLNVTFMSDFEVDLSAHPTGEELARQLGEAFSKAGISITAIDNYDDIGWSLDTTVDGQKVFLLLGYVADGDRQWLMQINPYKMRFLDLFRPKARLKECASLAVGIHEVLSSDEHINTIRWHKGHYSGEDYTDRPDA